MIVIWQDKLRQPTIEQYIQFFIGKTGKIKLQIFITSVVNHFHGMPDSIFSF